MALDNSIFRRPPEKPNYRLTINSEGLDRSGKTYFALSAPAPVGILKLDRNTDSVSIKLHNDGKDLYVADFTNPDPKTNPLAKHVVPARESGGKPLSKEKLADRKFYEERWEAISDAYYALVKETSIRTIVVDTGSGCYEDIRLARFGKLAQVAPRDYGTVNKELAEMVLAAKCNLIMTHRLKKQYKGNDWDGKSYEGIGYNGVGYDCQISLRHESALVADPDDRNIKRVQFKTTILNCSLDPNLMGLELTDSDCTFPTLAQLVYPEAPDSCWV